MGIHVLLSSDVLSVCRFSAANAQRSANALRSSNDTGNAVMPGVRLDAGTDCIEFTFDVEVAVEVDACVCTVMVDVLVGTCNDLLDAIGGGRRTGPPDPRDLRAPPPMAGQRE